LAPVGVTVDDLRLADEFGLGLIKLTPDASVTKFHIGGATGQDRTDLHAAVTVSFNDDGPGQMIVKAQTVQSNAADGRLSARTDALLAGIADTAPEIWSLRLLAGCSRRAPAAGAGIFSPMLTGRRVTWMKSGSMRRGKSTILTRSARHPIPYPP
jgi:hypothetical protein